jgi:transposase
MRFVAIKNEEQQANCVVFRARDVLVRQRTQCINALRGHLTEYGWVVPKGTSHMATLTDQIEDPNCSLPKSACAVPSVLVTTLKSPEENIAVLDAEISRRSREDAIARRLMTVPGVEPITATAIAALTDLDPTFALPYGSATVPSHQRPDRRQTRPAVPCIPKDCACVHGASTDVTMPSIA